MGERSAQTSEPAAKKGGHRSSVIFRLPGELLLLEILGTQVGRPERGSSLVTWLYSGVISP
jgi:hypothetical protein